MEQKQQPITFTPTLGNFAILLAVVAMLMVLIPIFFGCWHVAFVWIHLIAALGSLSCAIAAYREDEDKKKVVMSLLKGETQTTNEMISSLLDGSKKPDEIVSSFIGNIVEGFANKK
jgi:hypothetical protein